MFAVDASLNVLTFYCAVGQRRLTASPTRPRRVEHPFRLLSDRSGLSNK